MISATTPSRHAGAGGQSACADRRLGIHVLGLRALQMMSAVTIGMLDERVPTAVWTFRVEMAADARGGWQSRRPPATQS